MSSNKFNLTDFQSATAERIFRIFHDEKQNRVLLADEVGLGKTIVARAVIDKVYRWHIDELKDDLFKVVYIARTRLSPDKTNPSWASRAIRRRPFQKAVFPCST